MIESEAQRCRKIIDSLLSFSRRSEGAMSETDLAALIEESLSIVGKDLELKGITVESRCDDGPATVCVDVNQIQQVLLNIVTNAADAMSEGGRLSISTRPLRRAEHAGDPHRRHRLGHDRRGAPPGD